MFRACYLHLFRRAARSSSPSAAEAFTAPGSLRTVFRCYTIKSFSLYIAPTAAFAYLIYCGYNDQFADSVGLELQSSQRPSISMLGTMLNSSRPTVPIAPGRPETLTKEEEAKLKELWTAVFKVFGVATTDIAATTNENGRDDKSIQQIEEDLSATSISPGNPDQKKRKEESKRIKLGSILWGSRKEKEQKEHSPTAEESVALNNTVTVVNINEKDDKFGLAKEFKTALATQTPEDLRQAFWGMVKNDNPDALLLRFLRARKWDVEKSLVMLVSTMQWRRNEMKVHEIVYQGENGPASSGDKDFMDHLRMGKSFLHGWDKDGRPICYVRVRLHRAGDQTEESVERFTIYIMETTRLMLNNQVDTAAVVFDMTGFSLANLDYQPVKFLIKCFEAHYPESLGVCLVHKAPWIFQGIWTVIKGWLDPTVASKIHFTKSNEDLERFIPKEHIIKELSGPEDWEYVFQEPTPGEDAALEDKQSLVKLQAERAEIFKKYEDLTRVWINEPPEASTGDTQNATEVLSRSKIMVDRFDMAKLMREEYWKMDKHIRGRTFYDRTGVICSDGRIDFYSTSSGKGDIIVT